MPQPLEKQPLALRKFLFAALYLSEGAPIGFIWIALPYLLEARHVPAEQNAALTALAVLPWTFKFLWAPLVDRLRSPRWTLQHWILAAQAGMVATLVPLLWLDLSDVSVLRWILLAHAICAATQDVSIDALCISSSSPEELGRLNGWMQGGMLIGRSLLGGGALVIMRDFGQTATILALMAVTGGSSLVLLLPLLMGSGTAAVVHHQNTPSPRPDGRMLFSLLLRPSTLALLAFALTAGAAFEGAGMLLSPLLKANGFSETQTFQLRSISNVVAMGLGSLIGGRLADSFGKLRVIVIGVVIFCAGELWVMSLLDSPESPIPFLALMAVAFCAAFGIGLFVAASYALFMEHAAGAFSATRFSIFVGATNACESWAGYSAGQFRQEDWMLPGIGSLCVVSLTSTFLFGVLPHVLFKRPRR